MYLHTVTGGLAAGAIAGIVIGAVVFALLPLIMIPMIFYYMHLRAKNQKSVNVVCKNNCTTVGDLQTDHHQVEKSQSYAQPLDATTPKDSTHSDNQSNTVLQTSDRRRFLKRQVCTSLQGTVPLYFVDIVVDKTITRTRIYILQHQNCFFICYSIYIILLLVFFFLQYSDVNSYSFIDEEAETNLSHEACLISVSSARSVIHNNNLCISSIHE